MLFFCQKSLRSNSALYHSRHLLAAIYYHQGKKKLAIQLLEENLKLDSLDYVAKYLNLVFTEKCVKTFLQSLEKNPEVIIAIVSEISQYKLKFEAIRLLEDYMKLTGPNLMLIR